MTILYMTILYSILYNYYINVNKNTVVKVVVVPHRLYKCRYNLHFAFDMIDIVENVDNQFVIDDCLKQKL